ncbi:MAG: hypothetical protein KJ620_01265 [Candidatus Edwardsbacteria bacterium]|nr:hypothetical protein [Candidatus Edwardsbacteria bacterium]MBU1576996.1 hypothetical protein [Candidatus Edwardsbacteria bacterium]MBU2464118.1 hypothetical protein [Candidatus Edwardsbacteria bacterium]MBU2594827.1 hypothetical protein [Candidatus Edwardsbacteria bacterium]
MKIIETSITRAELGNMAKAMFGNMVKAVVDVEKGIMAVGGELHSDEEGLLLENGSEQKHLWGINIYPEIEGEGFIEFDSMINLRPSHNNLSRGVDDKETREKIIEVVTRLVK